jgi:hypothetical protein
MFWRLFSPPRFENLAELPPDHAIPVLDRRKVSLDTLTSEQRQWREEGVVILEKAIPDSLIDAYCGVREPYLPKELGFPSPTAYLSVPQIRDIALHPPVAKVMETLIGQKMALHFDLTQWVSTERQWHQDDYLNPPEINAWYMAVWFALDDIHADSGPFEYVPGSHRWPVVRGHLVRKRMSAAEAASERWPHYSEKIVTRAYEQKLADSKLPIRTFMAKRGDVLIWHGRLLHRGSRPRQATLSRKALICHYTAINKITPAQHELAYSNGYPYIIHRNVKPFAWPPSA